MNTVESTKQESRGRAVRRHRRRQARARAEPRRGGSRSPGGGQYRRRLRASGPIDLARSRHHHVRARRPRRPATGLGPARRDLDLHGRARSARRRNLVQLGDGDLATHVERTRRLAAGESLSAITADFCRRLGIAARLVPMSDDKVRTRLRTSEGWLDFQDYFVRRRCAPAVRELAYEGAATARAHPEVHRRAARLPAARGRHLPVNP